VVTTMATLLDFFNNYLSMVIQRSHAPNMDERLLR